MNKTELIAAIAEKAEISKKDSEKALKAFVDVIRNIRSKQESSKRRKKPADRKDNEDRGLQGTEVQSRKSFKGCNQLIFDLP